MSDFTLDALERENAVSELGQNRVLRYCVGPGWPVLLVRTLGEFDFLHRLSTRGVRAPHKSEHDAFNKLLRAAGRH